MTISQFKQIARTLKKIYEELEAQAVKEGISLLSPEYKELMDKTRLAILEKNGFTLEEYRSIKEQVAGVSKEGTLAVMQDTQKKLEEVEGRHIPTEEEIAEIAERVAQKYIVPPQITNEIVKEITIEKPQIIETTREIVRKEKYDDSKIQKKLEELKDKLAELKIPEPYDDSKLKEYFHDYFSENFEKNINTLGMPDFRKLAMGLQAQIDAIDSSGSVTSIVGITGTKAQFDTAVTDGNFLYVGDVTSNATHTGEVTGATTLTVDKTAITGKTEVTAAVGDYVLVADASDSSNLKKVTVQTIVDQAVGSGVSESLAIAYAVAL